MLTFGSSSAPADAPRQGESRWVSRTSLHKTEPNCSGGCHFIWIAATDRVPVLTTRNGITDALVHEIDSELRQQDVHDELISGGGAYADLHNTVAVTTDGQWFLCF